MRHGRKRGAAHRFGQYQKDGQAAASNQVVLHGFAARKQVLRECLAQPPKRVANTGACLARPRASARLAPRGYLTSQVPAWRAVRPKLEVTKRVKNLRCQATDSDRGRHGRGPTGGWPKLPTTDGAHRCWVASFAKGAPRRCPNRSRVSGWCRANRWQADLTSSWQGLGKALVEQVYQGPRGTQGMHPSAGRVDTAQKQVDRPAHVLFVVVVG